ncbi:MAG: hypothetical protein IH968_11215 [Gemmatimonadetes bacterium]|nr:hypothetical protein [Gemmatimonadota bacterium]
MLGLVALILLTQVGYSGGIVLARKGRDASPGLLDLALIVLLWVTVFLVRPVVGKWTTIGLGLVLGAVTGYVVGAVGRKHAAVRHVTVGLRDRGFKAWWKRFATAMGSFQGLTLMGFFYFVALNPFALLSRLSRDPLRLKRMGSSHWVERAPADDALDRARSQF